jgi:DNA-binding XRE family transcriptional regulator
MVGVGWHADPWGRHEVRYFDGNAWTEHVSDAGQVGTDPPDGPPPPATGLAEPPPISPGQAVGPGRFVAELIARREARGVSQANLARITGLRRKTISELESGQTYPDWHTLSRLAYALEADLRFVGRRAVRVEPEPRV